MAVKKKPLQISPKGVAKFPWLSEPDTAFNQSNYKVTLLLPEDDPATVSFMHTLDDLAEKAYQTALEQARSKRGITKALPYREEIDPETDEPTGMIEVNFKQASTIKSKETGEVFDMQPTLFDTSRNKLDPAVVKVGGGSVIRVAYQVREYFMPSTKLAGVTLKLRGVQVCELKEYTGGCPFGEEPDGYEAPVGSMAKPSNAEEDMDDVPFDGDDNGGDF